MDDGFLELLAPRRGAESEDKGVAMAHLSWSLHLWPRGGDGGNRAFREVDILTNQEELV